MKYKANWFNILIVKNFIHHNRNDKEKNKSSEKNNYHYIAIFQIEKQTNA